QSVWRDFLLDLPRGRVHVERPRIPARGVAYGDAMEPAASKTLDRRTLLKLASSSWIYLLGTQLACGSEVKSEELSTFLASKNACALVDELGQLRLDGAFVFDAAACTAIAVDFGHYVHETPLGILKPASARDIEKLMAFAHRRAIPVVMRGTGG